MSDYRIQGATGEWEVVIGLEVHAQVTSKAKLFSGAATAFGAEPNSQVSAWSTRRCRGCCRCRTANASARRCAPGMAIEAQINKWSRFDRKNYFYADLPQGYQISQLYHPIVGEGAIDIEPDDKDPDATKLIGIERIHVEQDAGKLMHDQHPTMSYVDLNRSGVALMEIVSRPDMRSPAEAGAYVRKLRSILRYVGIVRRQHGRRLDARRRQRQRAQAGRRIRHADRDQERQFGALRDGGDRAGSARARSM